MNAASGKSATTPAPHHTLTSRVERPKTRPNDTRTREEKRVHPIHKTAVGNNLCRMTRHNFFIGLLTMLTIRRKMHTAPRSNKKKHTTTLPSTLLLRGAVSTSGKPFEPHEPRPPRSSRLLHTFFYDADNPLGCINTPNAFLCNPTRIDRFDGKSLARPSLYF